MFERIPITEAQKLLLENPSAIQEGREFRSVKDMASANRTDIRTVADMSTANRTDIRTVKDLRPPKVEVKQAELPPVQVELPEQQAEVPAIVKDGITLDDTKRMMLAMEVKMAEMEQRLQQMIVGQSESLRNQEPPIIQPPQSDRNYIPEYQFVWEATADAAWDETDLVWKVNVKKVDENGALGIYGISARVEGVVGDPTPMLEGDRGFLVKTLEGRPMVVVNGAVDADTVRGPYRATGNATWSTGDEQWEVTCRAVDADRATQEPDITLPCMPLRAAATELAQNPISIHQMCHIVSIGGVDHFEPYDRFNTSDWYNRIRVVYSSGSLQVYTDARIQGQRDIGSLYTHNMPDRGPLAIAATKNIWLCAENGYLSQVGIYLDETDVGEGQSVKGKELKDGLYFAMCLGKVTPIAFTEKCIVEQYNQGEVIDISVGNVAGSDDDDITESDQWEIYRRVSVNFSGGMSAIGHKGWESEIKEQTVVTDVTVDGDGHVTSVSDTTLRYVAIPAGAGAVDNKVVIFQHPNYIP